MRGVTPEQLVQSMVHVWATRRATNGEHAFAIDGEVVRPEEVSKSKGLLPLILWHAEGLMRFGVKTELGMGTVNVISPTALLGVELRFDRPTRPLSEVLCYVVEALHDMATNMPRATNGKSAELRALVNSFAQEAPTLTLSPDQTARPLV